MNRYWLFALPACIYLAAVCQTTVSPALAVRDAVPNWFLLLAVSWILLARPGSGSWLVAALVGLMFDLVSPGRPGLGLALFGGLALGLEWLHRHWSLESLPLRLGLFAAAALLMELALAAVAAVAGSPLPLTSAAWLAVRCAVYTAAVALPVLMILSWIPRHRAA